MNELMGANAAAGQLAQYHDPWMESTVGENIDRKIKRLQDEIARLEESKKSLSPLLSMRIRDIQQAMQP